jgi:hypothetical protein
LKIAIEIKMYLTGKRKGKGCEKAGKNKEGENVKGKSAGE